MSTQSIQDLGYISEGSNASYSFSFTDKDDAPITLAEKIQYKLSDGINILIDWTEVSPPNAPGEINIPGDVNRVLTTGIPDRYLTIFVTHNNGKDLTKTIKYNIINSPNITDITP